MLLLLAGVFAARAQLAYWALGADFRASLDGPWSEPRARQIARGVEACMGRTSALRVLHWAGIDGDGSEFDEALACAAAEGHLDTVRTLVGFGDDVNRPARDRRLGGAVRVPPIAQAMRDEHGLAIADFLLAHGASLAPQGDDSLDAVQRAAAARCLACLRWLGQHGAAFDRTMPATPMTLWIDSNVHGPDEATSLQTLAGLGLSSTAIGADGRSPLHAAAAQTNAAWIGWLIEQGDDPTHVDRFGMLPLFYAGDLYYRNDPAHPAFDVVLDLLARTPDINVVPPKEAFKPDVRQHSADGGVHGFGTVLARDARLRDAVEQQGKTARYADEPSLIQLPPDAQRKALDALDDATLAAILHPGSDLLLAAARDGAWSPLARAMKQWQAPNWRRGEAWQWLGCKLLNLAVTGAGDASSERADSWTVVQVWLSARDGAQQCSDAELRELVALVEQRGVAQQADWNRREIGMRRVAERAR